MNPQATPLDVRRHDLDALRAFAMLLGLVLHGAMSFIPGIKMVWGVEDSQANAAYDILISFIHGWRMPLFFLISGFFTAMLWQKRGLRALLWHRFQRIFLPLMLGMITIIPLTWMVYGYIRSQPADSQNATELAAWKNDEAKEGVLDDTGQSKPSGVDIWAAVATADHQALEKYLDAGGDIDAKDPNGSTPLHVACFLGRADVARRLLQSGASLDVTNNDGKRPEELLTVDWRSTAWIAGMLQLPVEKEVVLAGREEVATAISKQTGRTVGTLADDGQSDVGLSGLIDLMMYFPLFHHLWFLWFLCWYVCAFAVIVKLLQALRVPMVPLPWLLSVRRFAWLIPLTALPQFLMARTPGGFGPDTSIGLLPIPSVLAYYAVFFAFGALYFSADDREVLVGRGFSWMLIAAVILLFPLALSVQGSTSIAAMIGFTLMQVCFAWVMSFGMIGLFHRYFRAGRFWIRYLSDSSYWLYMTHIPLIIVVQFFVRDLPFNSWLKFVFVCSATTIILLVIYQLCVRNTWMGALLNGRKYPRPAFASQELPTVTNS